jgi:hypothetical protein
MKVTKIYVGHVTRDKNTQFTEIEVSAFIDLALSKHKVEGATIYDATGYWRGDSEPCSVIEVIHHSVGDSEYTNILKAALFLKRFLHQESVLLTTQDAEVTFL